MNRLAQSCFLTSVICIVAGCSDDAPDTGVVGPGGAPVASAPDASPEAGAGGAASGPIVDASRAPDATVYTQAIPLPPERSTTAPVTDDACGAAVGARILAEGNAAVIVADDTHVYFVDSGAGDICSQGSCFGRDGAVVRVPRCGGASEILAPAEGFQPQLLDGGTVVYAIVGSPADANILRVDKATGRATTLQGCAQVGAATSTHLFFVDSCTRSIRSVAHGELDSVVVVDVSLAVVTHLVATTEHLFYTTGAPGVGDSTVVRHTLADGSSTVIHQSPRIVQDLVTDGNSLLVGENTMAPARVGYSVLDGEIFEFDIDGTSPRSIAVLAHAAHLDVDGANRYLWWEDALRSLATTASGGPPTLYETPDAYDVHDGVLYWSASGYVIRKSAGEERAVTPDDATSSAPLRRFETAGAGAEAFKQIAVMPDGAFATIGTFLGGAADFGDGPFGTDRGELVAVYDAAWNPRWRVDFDWEDHIGELRVAASGDLYVDAYAQGVRKLAADGSGVIRPLDESRARRSVGLSPGDDLAVVAQDPGSQYGVGPSNAVLEMYGPSLDLTWSHPIVEGAGVAASVSHAEGAFYVTGRQPLEGVSAGPASQIHWYTGYVTKLSATGDIVWQMDLPRLAPFAIVASPEGELTVAARSEGWFDAGDGTRSVAFPGRPNVVVVRYDSSAEVVWVRTFEVADSVFEMVSSRGGGVALFGHADAERPADLVGLDPAAARIDDPFVVSLDGSGAVTWTRRIGGMFPMSGVSLEGGTVVVAGGDDDGGTGGNGVMLELGPT